ncbi:MAG: nascent polypeptide-associated complex protein [Methanimicrococcus sp.]|nr:nascent polypeptide-associated complex protein [Methanimicrococcus sp.]
MFPGMGGGRGGMNPKKMQGMMKQLGIEMLDIDNAEQVIIKTTGGDIIIDNPSISIMRAQGVDTYQINGDVKKVQKQLVIPAEDVRLVCEQTGASEEEAKAALEKNNGDLAEAILSLSS